MASPDLQQVRELQERLQNRVRSVVQEIPEGQVKLTIEEVATRTIPAVRIELEPANPKAAHFEVTVDDAFVVALVGAYECSTEIDTEDAVRDPDSVCTYVEQLARSVVSGGYSERIWHRGSRLARVHGLATLDGQEIRRFEVGPPWRPKLGVVVEDHRYEPY